MVLRKIFGAKGYKIIIDGIWKDHPIGSMVLGICSALAVSNKVENAIAMGAGVTFVLLATAVIISLLRSLIPQRVRIITYMITISSFVIVVDKFLQAFYPTISESIGPYVGLIITNCIIMGRAEAFYVKREDSIFAHIFHSILDAVANGISYSYTLIFIAIIREPLGFGTLLGFQVMPDGWVNWIVMSIAPGAFFLLGIFLWIIRSVTQADS